MVFSTNKWEEVGLLPLILGCDHYIHNLKKESWGTSLMVHQLRLPLPMQGVWVPFHTASEYLLIVYTEDG